MKTHYYVVSLLIFFLSALGYPECTAQSQVKKSMERLKLYPHSKFGKNTIEIGNLATANLPGKMKGNTMHNSVLSTVELEDSNYQWDWDTLSHGWHTSAKSKQIGYVYDANHMLLSKYAQYWSGSTWTNVYRDTYTYDANNNQLSYTRQNWSGLTWDNFEQLFYAYDTNNNMMGAMYQYWNGSAWEDYSQNILSYDTNNNLTNDLIQVWMGGAWVNYDQITYSYDANMHMVYRLSQTWNGSAWIDAYQVYSTWDISNNLVNERYQTWTGTAWMDFIQLIDGYDSFHNIISSILQVWTGSTWIDSYQYSFSYDAGNNRITALAQTWSSGAWVNTTLDSYTYDVNNFRESYAHKSWDSTGTNIESGDSTYYYHHGVLVGIDQNEAVVPGISSYPNPVQSELAIHSATGGAQFDMDHAVIFNMLGERVAEKTIDRNASDVKVDVSPLPSGIYFVKVFTRNGTTTLKFLKN